MKKYFAVISILSIFSSFANAATIPDVEPRTDIGIFGTLPGTHGLDAGLRVGRDIQNFDYAAVGVEVELKRANVGAFAPNVQDFVSVGPTLHFELGDIAEGWDVEQTFKIGVEAGLDQPFTTTVPFVQFGPSFKYRPNNSIISARFEAAPSTNGGTNAAVLVGISKYFF